MDETLLDKARTNYDAAKILFNAKPEDERLLCLIGYHLQQALELSIKHILECEGVKYPYNHSIESLISLANNEGIDLKINQYIDDHAEMFTSWESQTRYIKGYRLEYRKIQRAIDEIKDYLTDLNKEQEIEQDFDEIER